MLISKTLFFTILNTESLPIRLVGGSNVNEGRVEIYFNKTWSTVCHNYWQTEDAMVVCRQLGLPQSNAQPVGDSVFGQGSGQIWLNSVPCTGSEDSLYECPGYFDQWEGTPGCDHSGDAGVICTNGIYSNKQLLYLYKMIW